MWILWINLDVSTKTDIFHNPISSTKFAGQVAADYLGRVLLCEVIMKDFSELCKYVDVFLHTLWILWIMGHHRDNALS